jgi:hypothetical protein
MKNYNGSIEDDCYPLILVISIFIMTLIVGGVLFGIYIII